MNELSVLETQRVSTPEVATIVPLTQGEVLDELKIVAALYAGEGQARQALEYYTQSLTRQG